ncbi:MAG: metallophosphoesterase [Paludibacter sp.]|jgi:predicted MPP superfamily phosphohydrolase
MKKASYIYLLFGLIFQFSVFAAKNFRFALFTDIHISILQPQNSEDLQFAVNEVNSNDKIQFVLVTGDDTDLGDTASMKIAKKILDGLKIPYHITSGNHDTAQGKNGSANFIQFFGMDKFSFSANGFQFIGFPTGPLKPNQKGHIATEDFEFVKAELIKLKPNESVFLITHYPLLEGDLDNRMEMIHLIKKYDVKAVLNGHYHRNAVLNYEGTPGIVNRSTQREKQPYGGYTLYNLSDSLYVSEKIIGQPEREWLVIPLK